MSMSQSGDFRRTAQACVVRRSRGWTRLLANRGGAAVEGKTLPILSGVGRSGLALSKEGRLPAVDTTGRGGVGSAGPDANFGSGNLRGRFQVRRTGTFTAGAVRLRCRLDRHSEARRADIRRAGTKAPMALQSEGASGSNQGNPAFSVASVFSVSHSIRFQRTRCWTRISPRTR